tara:strand:- start:119 stop:352 length:234 start_codon:yes stop_codon:yes gene_type:complete
MEMMSTIDLVLQYLAAPLAAVVWVIFNKATKNERDIAVLQSQVNADKTSHDREMKEMKETIKAIFIKLDNIEQALRK